MFTPSAGVPASPPVYGLVATQAALDPPPRWENGIAWVPERCGVSWQLVPWCGDPDSESDAYTPGGPEDITHVRPVPARVGDRCSTMSGHPDLDRVRRIAEATWPFLAARELWSGTGTLADPFAIAPGGPETFTNPHLASTAATTVGVSAAANATAGVARLEQAAVEASGGQAVMLHLPPLIGWRVVDFLTRVGQSWLTPAGNVVVVDGGYPGTGPAGQAVGATAWAYASSPVSVLAAGWEFIDDDPSTVDPASNTRTTWASRLFAPVWDPCVHLATEITL